MMVYDPLNVLLDSISYYFVEDFCILSKISNKTRRPTLTTFIQLSIGSPSHSNQTRKRNERNPNWKGRSKRSLFIDNMIYIEIPRETTRKLLELTNEVGNTSGYKSIYRNLLHFYALTPNYQKEKLRKHPIYYCIKNNKILGTNLPKEVKDLYMDTFTTLMKETEDNTNRWKDTAWSQTRRINTVKMTIPPKAIYRFNSISI